MKKNRTIIIVTILLLGAAAFFVFRNNSSRLRKENREFSVQDTTSVSKIFIADRSGNSVLLERKGPGEWIVNGKFQAQQSGVNLLLDCIRNVRVQTRVPKNSYNTVIKELSTTGMKCEIYVAGKKEAERVYYIGGSTMDVLGTYMMMDNSDVPFVTEIPGFNGYLTPRYSAQERDWRIKKVIWLRPEEIKFVSLEYIFQPEKSFAMERTEKGWRVYSPVTKTEIPHPDTLHIQGFLNGFRELNFEGWDRNFTDKQVDSLRNASPVTVITVTDIRDNKTVLPMYPKPLTSTSLAQTDSLGNTLPYDIDRMYAFLNNKTELVTVQYFMFNKVLASISDFDLSATKRKIKQ